MKHSRRSKSQDRLSELSDSLVLVILSLLPMRDVVKTTLLSKRFKDLWTTVPHLNFKSDENDTGVKKFTYEPAEYHNIRFQNFVNRALILWKGTKILKFKVGLFYYEQPPSSDVDVWMRFAMENEVEELHVNFLNGLDFENWPINRWYREIFPVMPEYCPHQLLYTCLSIRKLSLAGCKLEINGNVQWDQLKYLKIEGVWLSEHAMNQILCGTPQLEVLFLRPVEIYEDLNIQSSSLKALTIDRLHTREAYYNVLTIWAPKVETLKILGYGYLDYAIMNVSSLTYAAFDIFVDGYSLIEVFVGQVYQQTNRHVEKVALSSCCVQSLIMMKKHVRHKLESLSSAKFLKLHGCKVYRLVDLLEIFPKLTKLVLEYQTKEMEEIHWGINDPSITEFDTDNSLECQTDFPKSCLLHLTTVEIAWSHSNYSNWNKLEELVLPIVEFLLKNAINLEKLVVQATQTRSLEQSLLLLTAQKLLKIPRSSPTAEVVFCTK